MNRQCVSSIEPKPLAAFGRQHSTTAHNSTLATQGCDRERTRNRSSVKASGSAPFAALLLALLMLAITQLAHAANVTMNVTDPQISKDGDITITINGKDYPVGVKVGMKGKDKADAIAAALDTAGFTVDHTKGTPTLKLTNMGDKNKIKFDMGTTGEKEDSIKATGSVAQASIHFNNNFNPLDFQGDFAVFTAGFSTDAGPLEAAVSSQFLADTAGSTIASYLYELLNPNASAYGLSLTLNGDSILASYDSAYLQEGAGVIFGTTSNSPGLSAELAADAPEPSTLLLLTSGGFGLAGILRRRLS